MVNLSTLNFSAHDESVHESALIRARTMLLERQVDFSSGNHLRLRKGRLDAALDDGGRLAQFVEK
jgi:hypothetical protein